MTSVTPTSESGSPTGSDVGTVGALPTVEPDGNENRGAAAPASVPASVLSRYEPKVLRGTSCSNRDRECESQALSSSRNCLKWAESLQALLNDAEGLSLFQEFLQQEDPERFQMLEFWLACKGLSKQPPAQAHQLVRVIYAQLFLKAQLGIDERLRKSITQQIKDDTINKRLLSPTIFAEACAVVERAMNEVMHPNFLTSDLYLNYVQQMQADVCHFSRVETCQSTECEAPALPEETADQVECVGQLPSINQQPLPVLHEGKELTLCSSSSDRRRGSSGGGGGSTRSPSPSSSPPSSYLPQRHPYPYSRPQPLPMPMDSYPTKFLRQFGSVSRSNANPSRRLYNYSYNPVSRQDSELQSLSSDARTDSMSDLSLDEIAGTKETYAYKRQLQRQMRSMRENANVNKNSDLVASVIPRTSNPHARESAKPLPPREFAKNLIFKLEKLKKERDAEEIVVRKLSTVEDLPNEAGAANVVGTLSHHDLAEMDDSQEILDNHMARIWSDKTPRRSPSQAGTPIRPKSPDGRKVWPVHSTAKGAAGVSVGAAAVASGAGAGAASVPLRLPHAYGINTAKKKDKDVCSLFSSDSGNGTDPAEGVVDHRHRGGGGTGSLIKNKSTPEQDEPHMFEYFTGAASGYFQRSAGKAWSSSRRTLTDSGVSVISGSRGAENITPQSPRCKEKLVSSWLLDSNREASAAAVTATSPSGGLGPSCSAINEERDASTALSFAPIKHRTSRPNAIGYAATYNSSRCKAGAGGSGLPERGNGSGSSGGNGGSAFSAVNVRNVLPGQPFVADPSMPPFPFHSVDTETQLEETRRRLNEMGSKLNRMPTTMTSSSAVAAAASSSRSCENSCSVSTYPSQSCFKTETSVTHRPTTLTRSTNRKPCGSGGGADEDSCFTTVVYNFSDEQMPYLSRIPGNPITLRHFKDYMPKKGRYRYYFVTPCEDLEMQPIQEEITDDCEFLPLWKGKVIARIRAID